MAKPGYRLALVATLLAVVVVLLGAYTRLTHAGLGCPDWPGCYGFLGVPMSEDKQSLAAMRFPDAPLEVHKGWNEMVHRYFAGALGLVILGLAVQALRRRAEEQVDGYAAVGAEGLSFTSLFAPSDYRSV